ncbi:MAG TPA: class I tRNA ligase family protein [Pyrinomonadaceae bacterium]
MTMGENQSLAARRASAMHVRQWTVEEFYRQMVEQGVTRAYVLYENGTFTLSHPQLLRPVQAFFEFSQDFAKHEAVFIGRGDAFGGEGETVFFAFVHDTRRGLSQGGLRFKTYPNLAELLVDGLRLAQGMTRKNALAGLWWGGGKGIMQLPVGVSVSQNSEDARRQTYFKAYGRFVASLGGIYYTAEDVGTQKEDMASILSQNRFTTCIPEALGGSGNPSPYTATGVKRGMQAAWRILNGTDDLKGVRVVIQGIGNVGEPLVRELHGAGARLWISDIPSKTEKLEDLARDLYTNVQVIRDPEAIYDVDADILAPCAIGGTINAETIPRLRVRLVCGAANNILREPLPDAKRLRNRNIEFVPDFLCNRMGIINCADEWMGYLSEDTYAAVESVYPDTLRVFKHARNLLITTTEAANHLADIAASELNPLIGHRGRRIIDHLVASDWAGTRDGGRWKSRGRRQTKLTVSQVFDPILDEEPIRRGWEQISKFRGDSPSLAAAPIRAGEAPHLDSFLLPTILDVRARSLELIQGQRPRRILGSDHGGLNLQLAVERAIPYDRDSVGRAKFLELCQDLYRENDASIREQLHQLGVGFDPQAWLDSMGRKGQEVVRRLFYSLVDCGLLKRENYFSYHCPHCQTVLVSSDVEHRTPTTERYKILFPIGEEGESIRTNTFLPELLLGAVAVAVNPNDEYGRFAGRSCRDPLDGKPLPVIRVDSLTRAGAMFLVPAHSHIDADIAQANGITERPRVYDDMGRINVEGYADKDPNEVRQALLKRLGANVERVTEGWRPGTDGWKVERCSKCKSIAVECSSQEMFIDLQPAIRRLQQLIESDEVMFVKPHWKKRALRSLDLMKSWCISRQNWWGNPLPTAPDAEVLSPWFSLTALMMYGTGWPDAKEPESIGEIYINPPLLERLMIPAQLVSLTITGKPLFRQIHVYGVLHVVELEREYLPGVPENAPDEERMMVRRVRRPMRGDAGNIVQPKTLIRRFGADALRLGYLLCLDQGMQEELVLSEDHLRRARKAVRGLTAKVTGLFNLRVSPEQVRQTQLLDSWLLARCGAALEAAKRCYEENSFHEVAELLLDAIKDFRRYVDIVVDRPHDANGFSKHAEVAQVTAAAAIEIMWQAFGPVCPYLFERLARWTQAHAPAAASRPEPEAWLDRLERELSARPGPVELASPDPDFIRRLGRDVEEIGRLTRSPITPTEKPSAGEVTNLGPCLLIRSGAPKLPAGDSRLLSWYRSLFP